MVILKLGIILVFGIFLYNFGVSNEEPLVTSKLGQIRGSIFKTYTGKKNFAFRGIPYAKPPIGKLRFKAPEKLTETWLSQPFDASNEGPMCIQYDLFQNKIVGQEDCLVLNVYTPEIPKDGRKINKKAVMVFIHGGAFSFGTGVSTVYGPKKILDHDIILVTINYRISIFGFLSTQDEASPGNFGLLDQVMALKWVQENIETFGGDPNRVTIFGQSAGGASVGYHLLSELSTGLFKSAIVMSGSPLSFWAHDYKPNDIAEKFASLVNCSKTYSSEIVECLRERSLDEITKFLAELGEKTIAPFRPVVDGHFLKEDPITLYKTGKIINQVPLIFGNTKNEGLLLFASQFGHVAPKLSNEVIKRVIAKSFLIDDITLLENDVSKLIKNQYFKNVDSTDLEVVKNKLTKILADGFFDASFHYNLELYLKSGMKPFVYSFDYVTDHSIFKLLSLETLEPTHGDDLYFIFDSQLFFPFDYTRINDEQEKIFLELWVNFAKTSNPTPENNENSFKWLSAKDNDTVVCHLDNPITMKTLKIDDEIVNLWMKILPESIKLTNEKKDEL